eukprot:augustus_masked-scaffold_19-processed-gene-6.9-mRNA-1 protein AED:0.53 eAED:0.57 QI:0/-1/0/1/-1/1/1/0/1010
MILARLMVFFWTVVACIGRVDCREYNTSSQIDPKRVNVHLVQHSHDDTGWLYTTDEYFDLYVNKILSSVTKSLSENIDRTFVYAEMAFLARFMNHNAENSSLIEEITSLINKKQLEIVNGGWCMHDEATNPVENMIDQTTRGHMFLKKHFSVLPENGWQVDPFGHSLAHMKYLTVESGMQSSFIGRLEYKERKRRLKNHSLEFLYNGALVVDLFGSNLDGDYSSPLNFEFVKNKSDEIVDDEADIGYNLDAWMKKINDFATMQQKYLQGKHMLWSVGNDFAFTNAEVWYRNLDKIVHYSKEYTDGFNFIYSSPGKFIRYRTEELNKRKNFPSKDSKLDMFPLSNDDTSFWTGYFSSRQGLKKVIRDGFSYLNIFRQIETISNLMNPTKRNNYDTDSLLVGQSNTDFLEAKLSLATHHDGATGTARQAVSNDYVKQITIGIEKSLPSLATYSANVVKLEGHFNPCLTLNESRWDTLIDMLKTKSKYLELLAWNPQLRAKRIQLQLPVLIDKEISGYRVVKDLNLVRRSFSKKLEENDLVSGLVPITEKMREIGLKKINNFNKTTAEIEEEIISRALINQATHDLYFSSELEPLVFTTFYLVPDYTSRGTKVENQDTYAITQIEFNPDKLELTISKSYKLRIQFGYYIASEDHHQASGAYILRTDGTGFYPIEYKSKESWHKWFHLKEFSILRLHLRSWIEADIIVFQQDERNCFPTVEVKYTIGPVPNKNSGKEVIIRYSTEEGSGSNIFFTDSNGKEQIKRKINYASWSKIAANMYPVTQSISHGDLEVFVDNTQGAGVNSPGKIEMLVHRRLRRDDNRGVGEVLNEMMCGCNCFEEENDHCYCSGLIVSGRHLIQSRKNTLKFESNYFNQEPLLIVNNNTESVIQEKKQNHFGSSFYKSCFNSSISLMTLTDTYANILDQGRIGVLIRLSNNADACTEVSTGCMLNLLSAYSIKFQSCDQYNIPGTKKKQDKNTELDYYSFGPYEIKTFRCYLADTGRADELAFSVVEF